MIWYNTSFIFFVRNRKNSRVTFFFLTHWKEFICKCVSQDLTSPPTLNHLFVHIHYHSNITSWLLDPHNQKKTTAIIKGFITHQWNRLWLNESYITKKNKYRNFKLEWLDTFANELSELIRQTNVYNNWTLKMTTCWVWLFGIFFYHTFFFFCYPF